MLNEVAVERECWRIWRDYFSGLIDWVERRGSEQVSTDDLPLDGRINRF